MIYFPFFSLPGEQGAVVRVERVREREAGTETERIMAGRQVTPIKCKGGVRLRFP